MKPLFRLELAAKPKKNIILGFKWIEVLAIEPWALGNPDETWGSWCYKTISCMYVCRTEEGLAQISSEDLWDAVENGEYEEAVQRG